MSRMSWRNRESYVSRAMWHGEVGRAGKKSELYESMGKMDSWTVRCLKAHSGEREGERGRDGNLSQQEKEHMMHRREEKGATRRQRK